MCGIKDNYCIVEKFSIKIISISLLLLLLLFRSPNIVRVIKSKGLRWTGPVARMEEGRSAFKILTGKPAGKRLFGRPRRR